MYYTKEAKNLIEKAEKLFNKENKTAEEEKELLELSAQIDCYIADNYFHQI